MSTCPNCGQPWSEPSCASCGLEPRQLPGIVPTIRFLTGAGYLLGVAAVILLLFRPYSHNRSIRFHVFQNLLVHAAGFVWFISAFAFVILIPEPNKHRIFIFMWCGAVLGFLTYFGFTLAAFLGKSPRYPVLAGFADRLADGNILR